MRINNAIFIAAGLTFMLSGLLAAKLTSKGLDRENPLVAGRGAAPVNVIVVDPLEKVFQQGTPTDIVKPVADAAAGEVVTFQLVVNSDRGNIDNLRVDLPSLNADQKKAGAFKGDINVGYVGFVQVDKNLSSGNSAFRNVRGPYYPDPIRKNTGSVQQDNNQPIWISVSIPETQPAGVYRGTAMITGTVGGQQFNLKQDLAINLYPVRLRKNNQLWISNWWSDGANVRKFFSGNTFVPDVIARKMADNGFNSFIVNSLTLVNISENNGKYSFDYSRLDRYIKSFMDAGLNRRIEGGFIGAKSGDWTSNYSVFLPVNNNGKTVFQKVDINDPRVSKFYSQYFPSFVAYLKKNGYFDIFCQHIADEPVDQNVDSYNSVLAMVKRYAPEIKTIDAVQTDKVSDQLDIVVPILDVLDKRYNSFKKIQQSGHELAFYTCWAPQGQYANRLIQMELLKSRYLPWIDFRYNLSGYVHWAFNQWAGDPNTKSDNVAGDAWIVYPENNALSSSIRLDAFRDGINDYDLLTQLKSKNPAKAQQIAAQMVKSFTSYELDITSFRQARKELLQALAQ